MSVGSPHLRHPLASTWAKPGGPWDVPPLGTLASWGGTTRDAIIDPSDATRLDAPALADRVAGVAGGMESIGVTAGDVVLWQAPNWWEVVVLYLACWRLGAVPAPLHHRAGSAEVDRAVATLRPSLVLSAPGLPSADMPGTRVLRHDDEGGLPWGTHRLSEPHDVDPGSVAVLLHTSGSSGAPKVVVHTHRTLGHKSRQMAGVHGLGPADTVLMPAPLAHVSGLLNGVLLPAAAGMSTVLMDQWSPATAIDRIEAERVTFMVGPPTFFIGLGADPSFEVRRVASLRLVSSGGAGVTPDFVRDFTLHLGATVKRTYGSTEAPTVTTSWVDDPAEQAASTDGRPTPHTELRVVGPAGQALPPGSEGAIEVRGPEVCQGYLDADTTSAAFSTDGWYHTGDLGSLDDHGWLTVTGRHGDVVMRGGENVSLRQVEELLEAHPTVQAAVAVGVPDELLGERVGALVVADSSFDLDACRSWFAGQGAARYTTPELVVRVEALPVLPSGKPDRRAAADLVATSLR